MKPSTAIVLVLSAIAMFFFMNATVFHIGGKTFVWF